MHYFAFLASGAVSIRLPSSSSRRWRSGSCQNYAPAILSQVYGVSLVMASGEVSLRICLAAPAAANCGRVRGRSRRPDGGGGARPRRGDGGNYCLRVDADGGSVAIDGSDGIRCRPGWSGTQSAGASSGNQPIRSQRLRSNVRLRVPGLDTGQALSACSDRCSTPVDSARRWSLWPFCRPLDSSPRYRVGSRVRAASLIAAGPSATSAGS